MDGSVPDVAVLAIRPAEGTDRVVSAATGGGLRVHPALSSTRSVQSTLLGYPGPAPYNRVLMSACVGDYTHFPDKGRAAVQRVTGQSECHVGGGSSGGPYVTDTAAGPQIITVLNSNGGGGARSPPGRVFRRDPAVRAPPPADRIRRVHDGPPCAEDRPVTIDGL
ncbi:hypothetical protein ACIO14_32395 [Nocardia fluminea]|uniref:hypothetical protein n=1 Tax=Nocardia fluminea TaxID=134984 RepID=UPI0037F25E48